MSQMDLMEAIRLAETGAKLASDWADQKIDSEAPWSEHAYSFLRLFMLKNEQFQGEDVRMAAHGEIPEPPDLRAWGHIIQKAVREGRLRCIGYELTSSGKSHATPRAVWQVIVRD